MVSGSDARRACGIVHPRADDQKEPGPANDDHDVYGDINMNLTVGDTATRGTGCTAGGLGEGQVEPQPVAPATTSWES